MYTYNYIKYILKTTTKDSYYIISLIILRIKLLITYLTGIYSTQVCGLLNLTRENQ